MLCSGTLSLSFLHKRYTKQQQRSGPLLCHRIYHHEIPVLSRNTITWPTFLRILWKGMFIGITLTNVKYWESIGKEIQSFLFTQTCSYYSKEVGDEFHSLLVCNKFKNISESTVPSYTCIYIEMSLNTSKCLPPMTNKHLETKLICWLPIYWI